MRHVRAGLVALLTTAAAAGACATVWWGGMWAAGALGGLAGATLRGATGSAAVLATVIALSLGRREFASRSEFARSALLLPVIGVAAAGAGWLLVNVPVAGAAVFVAGMSVPVWMRRFGAVAGRVGALVALPLTAVLVVPVGSGGGAGGGGVAWVSAVAVLGAGVVAVLWVAGAREVVVWGGGMRGEASGSGASRGTGASPGPVGEAEAGVAEAGDAARASTPSPRPSRRLPASTRMALQMAAALSAAFVLGWLLFPAHAMWVVLTAFIVSSGNRGRADVLHKSALRVGGALLGSVGAVGLAVAAPGAGGFAAVVVIFVALFAGGWLRTYSYAFWALTVTLVLTLLQGLFGVSPLGKAGMLAERMAAILVGAGLGIGAAWFVLPVKSTDVLRRRLADLLVALGGVLAAGGAERAARLEGFRVAAARVEELAPAHRARRMLGGRRVQPIDCIEAASELPGALDVRMARRSSAEERAALREAVGRARRSLAAPADLERVRAALVALAGALRA